MSREEEELLVAAEREDLELSQQLLEGHEPPIKLEQDSRARRIWIRFEALLFDSSPGRPLRQT